MRKRQKTKNMCELEKSVGEMARKKFMFCEGFCISTGIPFYDDYIGNKPCNECIECKRYLYRRQNVNLLYAVAMSLGIVWILISATPQGAIRWNLLFTEGVQEAFCSNVERIEMEDNTGNQNYSVMINGERQEWEVICLQTACIARRLNE